MANLATRPIDDHPARSGLDLLVVLAATASAIAAAWLLLVATTVLPSRDPAGIPFWTGVAVGFGAYVVLTAAYLARGRRSTIGRAVAAVASIGAIALGGAWIVAMLSRSGDFEGYVVLLGVILAGHGASLMVHAIGQHRARRPLAG